MKFSTYQIGILGWRLLLLILLGMTGASALQVPGHEGREILVSIPDRKLAVLRDGAVVKVFPVAVGAMASPSPQGVFQIANRIPHPVYYHPGVVVPPGKDNPLGSRWIGLTRKGYGIHGTNDPRSIGRNVSHGCIRLRNRDIQELFAMVVVGDVVKIRGQRDQQTATIFGDSLKGREALAADGDFSGGSK